MITTDNMTTEELESLLGEHIRKLRLRRELSQRDLADRAGISTSALYGLEKGRGATISTFVKVLKALGKADWLLILAPTVSVSPMQMLRREKAERQRAYAPRPHRKVPIGALQKG